MIVIEGPDGAGKTTLAELLCNDFNLKVGPRGTTDRDKLFTVTRQDAWWAIKEEMHCDRRPWVWDRLGPWSDPIYSAVSLPRRQCQFTRDEIATATDFVCRLGVLIVCMPAPDEILKNVADSHQMDGVKEFIKDIYTGYARLISDLGNARRRFFIYDYRKRGSYESVAVVVSHFIHNRKERECLSSSTSATSASDRNPPVDSPSS